MFRRKKRKAVQKAVLVPKQEIAQEVQVPVPDVKPFSEIIFGEI
jgi:hypothetical protein